MKTFISPKLAQVEPGLPQAYLPNFVTEWKKQKKPWTQFFRSIPPEYQEKAARDWAQYRSQQAKAKPGSFGSPAAPSEAPAPEAPAAAPEVAPEAIRADPQEFLQRLRSGINQFGRQFNTQTIRPYNAAIQQSLKALDNLAKMPSLSPEVEQIGEQLLQIFQAIQASDAEDAQLISQLGQVAQQLAASSTSAALTPEAPGAFAPGWYEQATEPVAEEAPPINRPRPQQLLYDKTSRPRKNWLQQLFTRPAA